METKILVVDDEPSSCQILSTFLRALGFNTLEAGDGDRALALYLQERPLVVLLDVRMPGKDGLETLRELRAIDPEANVIMVTAVHEEEIARKALREGAFDYVTKPINPDYLKLSLMTKLSFLRGDD